MKAAAPLSNFNNLELSSLRRLIAAAIIAAGPVAFAGPGDLDASFGEGGRAFVDFPNDIDVAATVIVQADGKLIVGRENDAVDDDFSVLRFNVDGSLDTSFDGDGHTSLDYPGIKGTTHVVLQQADGKIVAAGESRNTSGSDGTAFGLARYNGDGSVDTSFGVGGVVIHKVGGERDRINSIVQQSDGRLVGAGYTYGGAGVGRDMAFARFNTDGTLDSSFGANGSTVINFYESNGFDEVQWLAQQADGMLIAAGSAAPSNPAQIEEMVVVRLTTVGLLDPTFDGDGRISIDAGGDPSGSNGGNFAETAFAALQSDGKMVLAGTSNSNFWEIDSCTPILARLNTDGSLDSSFGIAGAARPGIGACANFHGLAIAPNGDLYLTGGVSGYSGDHFVARIMSNGDLDRSYGVNGVSIVDLGYANHVAGVLYGTQSIIRQPDGKIVTVASTSVGDAGDAQLVVARLLATGNSAGVLGFNGLPEASETAGIAAIPVRRTGGSFGMVSIDYETLGGSATSGADFTSATGTFTWVDGEIADKIISINIADDFEIEGSESFILTLSNPTGGPGLATTEVTVQIQDNDSPPLPEPPPAPPPTSGGAVGWEMVMALALLLIWSMRVEIVGATTISRSDSS